jgi:WXG100 family type VII secretion target
MSNVRVSYAEIDEVASRLGHGREEISGLLQSLQQHVEGLISSGFVTDHASGKFGESYRQYTSSTQTVIATLTEMQHFLSQTSSAIREMDAQIAARIH